jgi:hypothetical protein
MMVKSSPAIHLDDRGLTWQKADTDDPRWELRSKLDAIHFNKPPYSDHYPSLATILVDEPGAPKGNLVHDNWVIDSTELDLTDGAKKWLTGEATKPLLANEFIKGVSALDGAKAIDFSLRSPNNNQIYSATKSTWLFDEMDCVSRRWLQRDAGKPAETCKLSSQ